jgi:monoamine oxidase
MGALAPTERRDLAIRNIARFHPEITEEGMVDDHASMVWDTCEFTRGAFSFLNPGNHAALYRYTFMPEGRVFFAGEHCSLENAWIQGALVSALRAVEQIVGN